MVVGIARLVLALGQAHSLKDKRQVVRKIVDRVRARFQVAISEVEDHDVWQRATLGLATVGADAGQVQGAIDEVIRNIEELYVAPIVAQDVHVGRFEDFDPGSLAPGTGGPNAFTRELLAGDDDEQDDEPAPKARR